MHDDSLTREAPGATRQRGDEHGKPRSGSGALIERAGFPGPAVEPERPWLYRPIRSTRPAPRALWRDAPDFALILPPRRRAGLLPSLIGPPRTMKPSSTSPSMNAACSASPPGPGSDARDPTLGRGPAAPRNWPWPECTGRHRQERDLVALATPSAGAHSIPRSPSRDIRETGRGRNLRALPLRQGTCPSPPDLPEREFFFLLATAAKTDGAFQGCSVRLAPPGHRSTAHPSSRARSGWRRMATQVRATQLCIAFLS